MNTCDTVNGANCGHAASYSAELGVDPDSALNQRVSGVVDIRSRFIKHKNLVVTEVIKSVRQT